jgi:hypothetical protein
MSQALWDIASAAIIGKGGAGSPSLPEVGESDGLTDNEKLTQKYNNRGLIKEQNNFGDDREAKVRAQGIDAVGGAGASAVQGGAAAMNELMNGLSKLQVHTWEDGGCSGYYAPQFGKEKGVVSRFGDGGATVSRIKSLR